MDGGGATDGGNAQPAALRQAACSAFALGWNVGESAAVLTAPPSAPPAPSSLPLSTELTPEERLTQLVHRVRIRAGMLHAALTDDSREALTSAQEAFAANRGHQALRAFHTTAAGALMAEDSRLGKAYALGLTLWQLSAPPESAQSVEWYDAEQVTRAKHYLSDLHTVLPDHAAMGVLGSLLMWETYASRRARTDAVTLPAQGRTWRALLSGEKSATDDLSIADYVAAGRRAVENGKKVSGHILRQVFARDDQGVGDGLIVGVAVVVVLVAGVGLALAANDAGGQLSGSIVTLLAGAGGLGFVKKAWDSVAGVWDTARSALTDAALDIVIAVAITQLPMREDTAQLRSTVEAQLHPSGLRAR